MNTLSIHSAARCGGIALAVFCSAALAQSDPGMDKHPDSAGPSMGVPHDSGSVKVPPHTGTEEMVTKPKNVDPGIAGSTGKIDRENKKKSEQKSKRGQAPKSEADPASRHDMQPMQPHAK